MNKKTQEEVKNLELMSINFRVALFQKKLDEEINKILVIQKSRHSLFCLGLGHEIEYYERQSIRASEHKEVVVAYSFPNITHEQGMYSPLNTTSWAAQSC